MTQQTQSITSSELNLINVLVPSMKNSLTQKLVLILIGTLLITFSAKIQVPFYPVPMTMQTFVILMIGMTFGWKMGGLTVFFYLIEGAFGLPVFAGTPSKGLGFAYMVGPTGGYLVGFMVATCTVGYLGERGLDRTFLTTFIAIFIGTILIFVRAMMKWFQDAVFFKNGRTNRRAIHFWACSLNRLISAESP